MSCLCLLAVGVFFVLISWAVNLLMAAYHDYLRDKKYYK